MRAQSLISALALVFVAACSNDDTTPVQPSVPPTPEEQVVANCRAMRDKLESYAAAHNGSYGQGWIRGVTQSINPYSGEYALEGLPGTPGHIALEPYYDCSSNVVGYRITGYGKDQVLITLENVANVSPEERYMHDVTMANCWLVLDAVKRFAIANGGEYPQDLTDTNNDGKTVINLLPNGELLTNPVNSMQAEPADGGGTAGGIGYFGRDSASDGTITSFTMEAYSCDSNIMVTLGAFHTREEERVAFSAFDLRLALGAFRQASGYYPHDLDSETTPGGKTVLDLFAESTNDHHNPYTHQLSVPVVGTATGAGAIAYQPIETGSDVTSFTITARGFFSEILRVGPLPN